MDLEHDFQIKRIEIEAKECQKHRRNAKAATGGNAAVLHP
jgi:hypothetical protein